MEDNEYKHKADGLVGWKLLRLNTKTMNLFGGRVLSFNFMGVSSFVHYMEFLVPRYRN